MDEKKYVRPNIQMDPPPAAPFLAGFYSVAEGSKLFPKPKEQPIEHVMIKNIKDVCENTKFETMNHFVYWYNFIVKHLRDQVSFVANKFSELPDQEVKIIIEGKEFQFILSQGKKGVLFFPDPTHKNYMELPEKLRKMI